MPHDVRLSGPASDDLFAITNWIADRAGDDIAEQYVRRIEAHCRALAHFPRRGTHRPEFGDGVRSIPFERRATILYRVEEAEVIILRILHAGRDAQRAFSAS